MTVDQDQKLGFSNAHQPRTTTFERALALLDEPARSHRTQRQRPRPSSNLDADGDTTFSSTSIDASINTVPLTSPPRRRTRTSHPSSSLSGSPLKDYLKRHSIEPAGSEAERASTSTPRSSSSSDTERGHRAGSRPGSTSISMSTSTPRTSTETLSHQTFTRDPFLDDQTIETATSTPIGARTAEGTSSATASLYVSPRRPLRSSIFESSPRIPLPSPSHSTSTPAISSASPGMAGRDKERKRDHSYERPRQTSATLRYALETSVRHHSVRQDQDQDEGEQQDQEGSGDRGGDGDGEDIVREHRRPQRGQLEHTSFLDTESDPPTELDERFPAIDPAPRASPRPPQSTDPNSVTASGPEKHSQVRPVTSTSTPKSTSRDVDIWRQMESDYIRLPKTVTVSTPPELASVKGIDVEHLRSYVNGRTREDSGMEQDDNDDEVEVAATHSAPVGWTSRRLFPDLPLSRHDLEETVQGLRDEMEVMRRQLEVVVKAVGIGLNRNEAETPAPSGLPQHILNALTTIDALIHHTSPNERSPDQVLSVDNIEEMTRRVQDWEAIVRGRQSSSPSPLQLDPIDSGQQDS